MTSVMMTGHVGVETLHPQVGIGSFGQIHGRYLFFHDLYREIQGGAPKTSLFKKYGVIHSTSRGVKGHPRKLNPCHSMQLTICLGVHLAS